jgi:hypothetical protein
MYDTAFNKIERELRNEEGVANELDYVEQTSWVLFLKYLHDLEAERRNRAELDGTDYSPILAGPYAWEQWAAPKTDEQFDHNKARIGEDLIQFVNTELFPYLASFRQSASGPLRLIRAMIEFKQIIGRGTRAYEGKDFFSIWDFVQGHQNFNDPEWDGDPIDPAPPRSRGCLYRTSYSTKIWWSIFGAWLSSGTARKRATRAYCCRCMGKPRRSFAVV